MMENIDDFVNLGCFNKNGRYMTDIEKRVCTGKRVNEMF